MFERVAIVNRGEPAVRFIHAARELAVEQGAPLISIALYTEGEANAMFVREADEAVCIHGTGRNPYLDYDAIERGLRESGADAVWVGWGFVAEDPEFADRVERMGLTFIGPTGDVMRRLGDKIGAKRLAESIGVPVAPWSGGPVTTPEQARQLGETIGYPLMVKAAAGGGGRGIRRVDEPSGLADALESARREAVGAFGDDTVFLERVIDGGRHVEVQVVGDGHGGVWAAGVRDCSIQRRHQKVIEESASTVLSPEAEQRAMAGARELFVATGYQGAGTVEYLYQPSEDRLAFLEVNTRLQVEHPVTEMTTGLDLVKLQLYVAAGGRLEGDPPPPRGHAIEVRLNAEDPERAFAPAPGTVEHLVWPSGPGVRVETGVAQGDTIPPEFDSMIAKIIGYGRNREEARARVLRALSETTVVIRGGMTNKAFLAGLLEHPDVVAGQVDTSWLDRLTEGAGHEVPKWRTIAIVATAIDAYDAYREAERGRFFLSARRGRPQTDMDLGHRVDLRLAGIPYSVEVHRIGALRYRLTVDGCQVDAVAERGGPFERRLAVAGRTFRVVSIRQGGETLVEVDGLPHRVSEDDGGLVRAPSPGLLVDIAVSEGDEVKAGDRMATLESMKMEVALRAPVAGRVREVLVAVGTPVDNGSPVFRLETTTEAGAVTPGPERADFSPLSPPVGDDAHSRVTVDLDEFRSQVLGYDHSVSGTTRTVAMYRRDRSQLPAGDGAVMRSELAVLDAFADIVALSRNRRAGAGEVAEEVHSPQEFFHAFLRTMDATRAGLPPSFEAKLRVAVAYYGVEGLQGTPALEEALLWMFLAQQRSAVQLPAILAILGYHLDHPGIPEDVGPELLGTLDRVILATQLRHPAVGELARSVRFRLFDEPLVKAGRDKILGEMIGHLSVLARSDDPGERATHMDVLVACPLPLIRLMAALGDDQDAERRELIEVQTRRYYLPRALGDVRRFDREGRRLVAGTFVADGEQIVIVAAEAATAGAGDLGAVLADVGEHVRSATSAAADVYVQGRTAAGPAGEGDGLEERIGAILATQPLPEGLRRITVSVTGGNRHVGRYTFVRHGSDFVEDPVLRDLHPMIADRLRLWRLAAFDVRRLPAPEDVYLFEAVARSNDADRRLVALAEVRDLTPLRDAGGAIVAIPVLEQVLDSCLDGMRRAIADLAPAEPPQWNRMSLHIWPFIDLEEGELLSIVRALAPRTDGVGLEQVDVEGRVPGPDGPQDVRLRMTRSPGAGLPFQITPGPALPLQPLDAYGQKVLQARRRGTVFPYELIPSLLRSAEDTGFRGLGRAEGAFVEYDLGDDGEAHPVDRPYGENEAAIVFGTITTPSPRYPEGMTRVVIFGDPTKALGSVAEPECRRINAALDLADARGAPVEWFAVCSGAKIAMDSGTENMDWVARVLRRLIEFTQAGGEVNVVVAGINVGAQPYWNAEATMLMHTKGILIMTPDSAMVLTGKQSLEYSGGVAAEDNFGIGGYDRIMGPNGQAQYWASDLSEACRILLAHYNFAYVAPGERFPRRRVTEDPSDRDVRNSPHAYAGSEFTSIGDVFSSETNAERKRPFDIRTLMTAVADCDVAPLERWAGMLDADTAVVFDVCLGGYAATLIGIESHSVPRLGVPPTDGPESWSGGTLFPMSSKKVARAINAASGNRPVVVVANLSGFDGSPESLRKLQLEYGAEIGRAVVNFDGPIIFTVVSRYHGGAFVVFSAVLNDGLEVAAVDGSFASVIGGGPAAAVVFTGDVRRRTEADERMVALEARIRGADKADAARLRAELERLRATVRSEKQAEVAGEFDRVHSIQRAKEMGSVHAIIPSGRLRPYLIEAVARGMARSAGPGFESDQPSDQSSDQPVQPVQSSVQPSVQGHP